MYTENPNHFHRNTWYITRKSLTCTPNEKQSNMPLKDLTPRMLDLLPESDKEPDWKHVPEKKKHKFPSVYSQLAVCDTLARAAEGDESIETDEEGFVSSFVLEQAVFDSMDTYIPRRDRNKYSVEFSIGDIVRKGINPILERIGTQVERNENARPITYRGYPDIYEDYIEAYVLHSKDPIEEGTFDFIKGPMDFRTLAGIRNRIKDKADAAWQKHLLRHPEDSDKTALRRKIQQEQWPRQPFICLDSSVYDFTKNYQEYTAGERKLLVKFSEAVIYGKALRVTYQALHHEEPDELEFHTHYIRKDGNKLMIYGSSHSRYHHNEDEYHLVNLVASRVISVSDFPERLHIPYRSAESLGLDYNTAMFRDRMTFDAVEHTGLHSRPVRVVLRVRRTMKGGKRPLMPYKKMLLEPLHHSQTVCTDYPEDEKFGYIALFVTDYMRIKPILLSWGKAVEVVEPDRLRQSIADEIAEMSAMYQDTDEGDDRDWDRFMSTGEI